MKAARVNPVDVHVATSGEFPGIPPPPFAPGYDGAGVVEAVGKQSSGSRYACRSSTFTRTTNCKIYECYLEHQDILGYTRV